MDTHFGRLSRRFGWTEETDPVKAEHAVGALFPKKDWVMLSHHLIWHGRRCCHAQKPACGACPVARWCPSYGAGPDRPRDRRQAAAHRGPRVRQALAVLAAVLLVAALAGCDDETQFVPGPGPSKVKVDTAELRALKAEIGMEDCVPGPGGGALPAITLPCLGGGTSVDLSIAARPAGAQPVAGRVRAVPQGDAGAAGLRRPVRRPGAGARRRLRRPVPRQRPARRPESAGVTYPSLADPGGDLQDIDEFAKIRGMPTMYFVDADGQDHLPASPAASTPRRRSSTWSASTSG